MGSNPTVRTIFDTGDAFLTLKEQQVSVVRSFSLLAKPVSFSPSDLKLLITTEGGYYAEEF